VTLSDRSKRAALLLFYSQLQYCCDGPNSAINRFHAALLIASQRHLRRQQEIGWAAAHHLGVLQ
jgi:hypothetical protein